jgi:hypothetical protein
METRPFQIKLTRQLQTFSVPDPIDPLGNASGPNLWSMGLSLWVRLPELTQGEFDLFLLPVNNTRLLKP